MLATTRISIVALAAVALCAAAWTRVDAQPSFEVGFKSGLVFAKLGGSGLKSTEDVYEVDPNTGDYLSGTITAGLGDMKTGFSGGGYAALHVSPRFGVRLEALYARKGTKGPNSGTVGLYDSGNNLIGNIDISGTNTAALTYFEVPILAVMSFPAGPAGSFDVFAGPSISFKSKAELKAEVTASFAGQSQTQTQTTDLGSDTEGTDFGGVLGIGYSRRTGGTIVSADVRWTQGFSKVDKAGIQDWKNRALGLAVGVGFPVGAAR